MYRSSDSKLCALRSVTSVSAASADVDDADTTVAVTGVVAVDVSG